MNIVIVHFPINDAGGIHSWGENIVKGFTRLGHDVTFVHTSNQTRMKVDSEKTLYTSRYSTLPGEFIPWWDVDLNGFDFVLFLHPAPHPTAAYLNRPDPTGWMRLYRETKIPKIAVFHDEKWRQTNDWISEVEPDLVLAAQHRFLPAAVDYAGEDRVYWDYFPLDIQPEQYHEDHEPFGYVGTQWLQWKGHKAFIPMLPHVETPIKFYGSGIQYSYLAADGTIERYFAADHYAGWRHGEGHEYFGFRPYEEALAAMRSATFSIDLSTRGYTNMTHWEPLMFGTISMMERRVFEDQYNEIPEECLWVYDFSDLPGEISRLMEADRVSIARAGRDFIERTSRCEDVAQRIIDRVT